MGRLFQPAAQRRADIRQFGQMSGPVHALVDEVLRTGGDEFAELRHAQDAGGLAGARRASGQGQRRHAHPQCMVCGGSTAVGEGVQAEVDLVMEPKVGLHAGGGMNGQPLSGNSPGREFVGEPIAPVIRRHGADQHSRLRHRAEQRRPQIHRHRIDLTQSVETAGKVMWPASSPGSGLTGGDLSEA